MNLLITTIGDYNHSTAWQGANCDIILIDYRQNGCYKYPGIYDKIMTDELFGYDYYWMPDEDVLLLPGDINKMFDMMKWWRVDLGQPSIDINSYVSFKRFGHTDGEDIIDTDFVEVMCPCFSRWALLRCLSTFPKSKSGWGLDLAWAKILEGQNMAILNCIVAQHTRPVGGGGLYGRLLGDRVLPSVERKRLMKEYGVTDEEVEIWRS